MNNDGVVYLLVTLLILVMVTTFGDIYRGYIQYNHADDKMLFGNLLQMNVCFIASGGQFRLMFTVHYW